MYRSLGIVCLSLVLMTAAYAEQTSISVTNEEELAEYQSASFIFKLVKSIRKAEYQNFYGLTCAYISEAIPQLDVLQNNGNLSQEIKADIAEQVSLMKEYIDVGQIANNCN